MDTKFVAYKYVPLGFEMIIEKKQHHSEARIFSHWFNVYLTDDPENWDNEITLMNEMQAKLGALTTGQRLIRAHMAEICRRHPLFPQSIYILCEEIGNGRLSKPEKIGCEGRGLLDSLGFHDSKNMKEQRKKMLKNYVQSLKKWLAQISPNNPIDTRVLRFLGQSTKQGRKFVEKLISLIESKKISLATLKKLCEDQCRKTSILKGDWLPFPFGCFKCQQARLETPECQCIEAMMIDAGLLCAGEFHENKQMAHEYRRFIEENILVYAIAINSWLKDIPLNKITPVKPDSSHVAQKVYSLLDGKDKVKEWLAACLFKTMKDNHKGRPENGVERTELIDNFPEATSWIKSHLT